MNYIKKAMIIISILIVIIIIIIFVMIKYNEKKINTDEYRNNGDQIILSDEFTSVTNSTMYYTVKDCLEKFMYLSNNHIEEKYYMLSKKTIDKQNITIENITEKIKFLYNQEEINIKRMDILDRGNIQYYRIYYYLNEGNVNAILVILDDANMTFNIELYNQEWSMDNLQTEISKNDYNKYNYLRISEKQLVQNYIKDYIKKIYTNIEYAYTMLDEEYKNKKFPSVEIFRSYIEKNKAMLEVMDVNKYQVVDFTSDRGYTEYICTSSSGQCWIFRETSIMQYTIILDDYTINLPEVIENKSDIDKVVLNANRIIQAINNKDFEYVYNKIVDKDKDIYFKTQNEFEQYIKNNFFDVNIIDENEFYIEEQEDNFTCKVKLNSINKDKNIQFNFKVSLIENDFVISFN